MMIYRKSANFPYPVLAEGSDSYIDSEFELDIDITDDTHSYYFNYDYEINSSFMKKLIEEEKVTVYLIVQTKDSKYFPVTATKGVIEVAKNRLSLSNNRTSLQLFIQANETIYFHHNEDLNEFYSLLKNEISVPAYHALAYSNVITLHGDMKKPFHLFDQNLNENLNSEIKIELGLETIIIHYKKKEYQFAGLGNTSHLNNAYVYMGFTKALQQFIINNGNEGEVDLTDLDEPQDALDVKLYNLMRSKQIAELNEENIDEVIYLITDQMIDKFSSAVRGLAE